jgi:hypothetical protein
VEATPMITASESTDPPDFSRFADTEPETAWTAFLVATLAMVHDLREKARSMRSVTSPAHQEDPGKAADALLDGLYSMANQGSFELGLAEMTIDGIQAALYRNTTLPARWSSWAALQAAMQQAGDEIAFTVTGIADEMAENLADFEATGATDDEALRVMKAMNNVIGFMRVLVEHVRHGGVTARG